MPKLKPERHPSPVPWAESLARLLTGLALVVSGAVSCFTAAETRRDGDEAGRSMAKLQGRLYSLIAPGRVPPGSDDTRVQLTGVAESLFSLGEGSRLQSDRTAAIAFYKEAQRLAPDHGRPFLYCGLVVADSGVILSRRGLDKAAVSLFTLADSAYSVARAASNSLDREDRIRLLEWSEWNEVNSTAARGNVARKERETQQVVAGLVSIVIGVGLCFTALAGPHETRTKRRGRDS
jgi:hypothetical protein